MSRTAFFAALLAGSLALAGAHSVIAKDAKVTPHPGTTSLNPKARDVTRAELLDSLFGRLHESRNEDESKIIAGAIWKLWRQSDSPSADLLLLQGRKAMNARAFPQALAILDTVIKLKPDFAEAWNERATTYFLMRRFDKSLADIKQVLKLEPRHFGALAGRGMILKEMGKKRAALKAFRRALAIYPEMPGPKKAVKELGAEVEQNI